MGVPSFFRWLSRKYPELVTVAQEEKATDSKGNSVRVDCTKPNPNWQEFDNLYLDMNGIIHPCTHPDDGPAPTTEEEMFVLIFKYIDRIFAIVRPRKLLYMAIDGVAPRAKMNQQRSRRFRASKETMEKQILIDEVRSRLEKEGKPVPPLKSLDAQFDTNCITPGTPFMARLADALRWYIHQRLTTDPAWTNLQVILSDANSPGEGEHKIMEYIRRQRANPNPNHNPNTSHCMCGADADLIMLGLATHEVNFNIIREEFKPNGASPCELCDQYGHELMECQGLPMKEKGSAPIKNKNIRVKQEKKLIFIRLPVLREYLERDLAMPNISIPYDFERVIDDWVFLCFFVGNDFLPHLPSLEIREGAITRLVYLYKDMVYKMKGYLTYNGEVFIDRVQMIMKGLGKAEDVIFKRRQEQEDSCHSNSKSRGPRAKGNGKGNVRGGKRDPMNGNGNDHLPQCNWEPKTMAKDVSVETEGTGESEDDDESDETEADLFVDEIKLHEEGWRERYYRAKFDVGLDNIQFRRNLISAYMEGLCWVLRYYYQGCASWDWYYPYHYAPFASDFESMGKFKPDFSKKTTPFKPLEQLMSVFPAASKQHLPKSWQALMTDEKSPIIEFYPTDFRIDLNWKKHLWQGVALLPFVDEKLLLDTLKGVCADLTEEEQARNSTGPDHMFISKEHPAFKSFHDPLYRENDSVVSVAVDSKLSNGLSGNIEKDENSVAIGQTFVSPIKHDACPNLKANEALMVVFKNPVYPDGHTFQAVKLPKAKPLPRVLKVEKVVVKNVGGREHRNGTPRVPASSYNNRAVGPQGAKPKGAPPVTTCVARGGASVGGRGRGGNSAGNRGGHAPVVKAVVKPKPIVVTNKWALLEDLDE